MNPNKLNIGSTKTMDSECALLCAFTCAMSFLLEALNPTSITWTL